MSFSIDQAIAVIDRSPQAETFLEEILNGLRQPQKAIPSKFFYDAAGSRLFDEICTLPEYYLTRTEIGIMKEAVDEMVARIGPRALLIEYGSGSSLKTRILLDHLIEPAGYIPIDISKQHLLHSVAELRAAYPGLHIIPFAADYTTELVLPEVEGARPVVYFPGSTIGNFDLREARAFLRRVAAFVGPGGGLLLGADLKKEVAVIEAAYNDARGVTAAFNLNMLRRINRELGATFRLDQFAHRAFYNRREGRIEMHLVSRTEQCVRIGDVAIPFGRCETILTEYSYKYSLDDIAALAGAAGFEVEAVWTDARRYFSVQYLVAR